ncbi:glycosyltransferase family 59 protein [Poronia punctata]|nr:glycosyltransferase family 59 protein [Poronia punctata]
MSATTSSGDQSAVVWAIRLLLLYSIAYFSTRLSQLRGSLVAVTLALSYVSPFALSWLAAVSKDAPEPYLDEVFHIPQAQVYCQGRYFEWDDKITTPPGLYISTILLNRLLHLPCSVPNLRAFNVDIVACIAVVALICKAHLAQALGKANSARRVSLHDTAAGISIATFPVLFFFSGLYYTDPASTLVVLLAYANHISRVGRKRPTFLNDVYSLVLGLAALVFRQTNIFWVVVYMGGVEAVHVIKTLAPKPVKTPNFSTATQRVTFYTWRYSLGDIHDPPLSLAQPIDIVLCVASIAIAAIANLPKIFVKFIWPHGVILAAFGSFVVWNGGVVLGDKSNHVATIHLAQMLYIWPLFAFFSAPLLIPKLLGLVASISRRAEAQHASAKTKTNTKTDPARPEVRIRLFHLATIALTFCGALAIALLIVRFNTIIHPFTLADNRHYMFYVFRYSILRAWWIRYALAPVYVICAWLCWSALQGHDVPSDQGRWMQSPFNTATQSSLSSAGTATGGSASPPTSTVLMLILATALSLVTAPLVEPRYFILPWVFWRLLVPTPTLTPLSPLPETNTAAPSASSKARNGTKPAASNITGNGFASIIVLGLEIVWFLLINLVTMYVFVTRPFYWRAPDGSLLDQGRVQRFMW